MAKKNDKIQKSIIEEIQKSMILGDSSEDEEEEIQGNLPAFVYQSEEIPLQSHYLKIDLSPPKRAEKSVTMITSPISAPKQKLDSKSKTRTLTTRDITVV